MRSFTVLSTLLLSAVASAQNQKQTGPFNLVVESSNKTLNGQLLSACHSGAAIESLCLLHANNATAEYNEFYYNTTTGNTEPGGTIIFNLPVNGGGETVSEPLVFTFDPFTNVAVPQFFPEDNYDVNAVFDSKTNNLQVRVYYDDTKSPPKAKAQNIDRWYICVTESTGYVYTTLSWVLGKYPPENPSCQKVSVKKVPVKK